jgi:2-dehydropantoate 2-reductase
LRIAVVGAGAIGMLLAGKMFGVQGSEICLMTRTVRQAVHIRNAGIMVAEATEVRNALVACERFGTGAHPPWDWVVLAVKQMHIDEGLIQKLKAIMTERTRLLCMQNGVGHVECLTQAGIRAEQIYAAITTEGARKDGDHRVEHTGRGVTSIGPAVPDGDGSGGSEAILALQRVFEQAGLQCEIENHIHLIALRKLLINSIVNPLTAILGVRNGELLTSPHLLRLMRVLYDEACPVLQGGGLPILEAQWEQVLEVCRNTALNASSMLQDVRAGRQTEIDWITGSILVYAAKQHLAVPTHEAVYDLVQAKEPNGLR